MEIPGYYLDEDQLPENPKGTFSDTPLIFNYYYLKAAAPVTVEYVDRNYIPIAGVASEKLSGLPNTEYDTRISKYQKKIDGYELDKAKIPTNSYGLFGSDSITVTYVYNQIAQPVTVKYVDQSGKEIRASQTIPEKDSGLVGDAYDASTAQYKLTTISGDHEYQLDTSKLPTNVTGTLSDKAQTVTYVYNEIAQPVNVKYVDQQGKSIKIVAPITGNVGDAYTTKQAEISGYKFDRMKDDTPTSGKLGTKELIVTYVYDEVTQPVVAKSITVKYVDQAGTKIHEDKLLPEKYVGDAYDATNKDYRLTIAGYQLDEQQLPKNSKGNYSSEPITITYVYKKVTTPTKPTEPDKGNSGDTNNQQTGQTDKIANNGKSAKTIKAAITTTQKKLPQANENQRNTFIRFVVGMFLLVGLLIYTSVDFRRRYRE